MEQLKLLTTTAILTLLIWIGADQLLTVSATLDVALKPIPSSPNSPMLVSLVEGTPARFQVVVSGPRRVVTELVDADPKDIALPISEREPTPRTTITDLVERFRNQRQAFKNLAIESVDPPSVDLIVDRRITRQVSLVVRKPLVLAYDVEPKLEPNRITVETTALRLGALGPTASQIEIDVEPDLRDKPRGEPLTIELPVPLARSRYGQSARATPDTVQVFATLKSAQRRTLTIPTVPIRLAPGLTAFGRPVRAVVVGRRSALLTQTLVVTGSDDVLNRLDPDNSGIYGVIPLTESDYEHEGPLPPKLPDFVLPPGVTLVGEPEAVQIELVPIDRDGP